jgi:hypothetical protein
MRQLGNDSAYNFLKLGEKFRDAAEILNQHYRNAPDWPTFVVACQGLELYLKAFLRAKGMTLDDLKNKIGHDLQRAYNKSKDLGLWKVPQGDEEMITLLNQAYKERDFQYRASGERELPLVGDLISFLYRNHSAFLEQAVHST